MIMVILKRNGWWRSVQHWLVYWLFHWQGGGLDQDDRLIPVYCINPEVETAKSSFRVVAAKISQNLPSQYWQYYVINNQMRNFYFAVSPSNIGIVLICSSPKLSTKSSDLQIAREVTWPDDHLRQLKGNAWCWCAEQKFKINTFDLFGSDSSINKEVWSELVGGAEGACELVLHECKSCCLVAFPDWIRRVTSGWEAAIRLNSPV